MAGSHDGKVIQITDDNFDSTVLQSKRPFLLDLTAEWCGPCKAIAPVIEALASEYDGQAYVGAINIDDNPGVPTRYQVRSIPTLIMFKGGDVVGQLMGALPKDRIASLIDQALD